MPGEEGPQPLRLEGRKQISAMFQVPMFLHGAGLFWAFWPVPHQRQWGGGDDLPQPCTPVPINDALSLSPSKYLILLCAV